MTYRKKVDDNQAGLVKLGRELGAKIAITSSAGDGFPDTVWQYRFPHSGRLETMLVEIKDGNKPPSKRKLTPKQVRFHAKFHCYIIDCRAHVFSLLNQQDFEL